MKKNYFTPIFAILVIFAISACSTGKMLRNESTLFEKIEKVLKEDQVYFKEGVSYKKVFRTNINMMIMELRVPISDETRDQMVYILKEDGSTKMEYGFFYPQAHINLRSFDVANQNFSDSDPRRFPGDEAIKVYEVFENFYSGILQVGRYTVESKKPKEFQEMKAALTEGRQEFKAIFWPALDSINLADSRILVEKQVFGKYLDRIELRFVLNNEDHLVFWVYPDNYFIVGISQKGFEREYQVLPFSEKELENVRCWLWWLLIGSK